LWIQRATTQSRCSDCCEAMTALGKKHHCIASQSRGMSMHTSSIARRCKRHGSMPPPALSRLAALRLGPSKVVGFSSPSRGRARRNHVEIRLSRPLEWLNMNITSLNLIIVIVLKYVQCCQIEVKANWSCNLGFRLFHNIRVMIYSAVCLVPMR
jgi:hypothetical protein